MKIYTDFKRKPSLSKYRQASSVLLKRAVTDVVNEIPEQTNMDVELDYTENVERSLHKTIHSGDENDDQSSDRRIINFGSEGSHLPTITLVNYKSDEKNSTDNRKTRSRRSDKEDVNGEDIELRKGLLQDMSKVDARYAILKSRLDHETSIYNTNNKNKFSTTERKTDRKTVRKTDSSKSKEKEKKSYIGSMVADLEENSHRQRKENQNKSQQRHSRHRFEVSHRKRKPSVSSEDEYYSKRGETLKNETEKIQRRESNRSESLTEDTTDLRNLLRGKKESKKSSSDDEDELARKLREKIKEEKHKRLFGNLKTDECLKLKQEREELREKLKQKKICRREVVNKRIEKRHSSSEREDSGGDEWVENKVEEQEVKKDESLNDESQQSEPVNEEETMAVSDKEGGNDEDSNKEEEGDENDEQEDEPEEVVSEAEKSKNGDGEEEKEEQEDDQDGEESMDGNEDENVNSEQEEVEEEADGEEGGAVEEMQAQGTIVDDKVKDDKNKDKRRRHKHKSTKRRRTRHEFIVTLNGLEGGSKNISIKTGSTNQSRRRSSSKQDVVGKQDVNTVNVSNRKRDHSSSFTQSDEEFENIIRDKELKDEAKRQKHRHKRHSSSKDQRRRMSSTTEHNAEQLSAVDREILLAEKKLKTQKLLRRSLEQVQNVNTVYDLNKTKTAAFLNPHFQVSNVQQSSLVANLTNNLLLTTATNDNFVEPALMLPLVEVGKGNVASVQESLQSPTLQSPTLEDEAAKSATQMLTEPLKSPTESTKQLYTGHKASIQERCAFWPDCSKQSCQYIHPTVNCKSFPNCSFGDRCLYIHPTCKFADRCNNLECHFAHGSAKRTVQPDFAHSTPICKFIPNCTNTDCPFLHPVNKPCKFGSSCNITDCKFLHDGSAKHKWISGKRTRLSDRKFAMDDSVVTETPVTITLTSADY